MTNDPILHEWLAYMEDKAFCHGQFAPTQGVHGDWIDERGHVVDERARCCLGHLADMLGMDYPPDQGTFEMVGTEFATMPRDHWIHAVQAELAEINDDTPYGESPLPDIRTALTEFGLLDVEES